MQSGRAVIPAILGVTLGVLVNLASSFDQWRWWIFGGIAAMGLLTGVAEWVRARGEARVADSQVAFENAASDAVMAVETAQTESPSLEDEVADVSASLLAAVARLRNLAERADAFEEEVKDLVERAEAAKAAAAVHEEDAKKIATLLGAASEERFKEEIDKLTAEYDRQITDLRQSGNRTAWITFALGAAVGFLGNVVVALMHF